MFTEVEILLQLHTASSNLNDIPSKILAFLDIHEKAVYYEKENHL